MPVPKGSTFGGSDKLAKPHEDISSIEYEASVSTTFLKSEAESKTEISEELETELSEHSKRKLSEQHRKSFTRRYFRSIDDGSITSLQGLDRLSNEEYLFIRRTKNEFDDDFIDSSHIYDILNSSGERVFSAVKTFLYENCDRLLQLDVCILETEGGGVLSIKGDSATISVCTLTFSGDLREELGKIYNRKHGSCTKHELDVQVLGEKLFRFHRPHGKQRGEFEVDLIKGKIPCGRTSLDWTNWLSSSPMSHCYGVGFSKGMDNNAKALLMSAMIVVYFDNFDADGHRRRGYLTFDRICCLIFGILFVIIMIILTTVVILRVVYSEF